MSAATLIRWLGPEPLRTTAADEPGPAYRALAARIRGAVLDGRLAVGSPLPSERDLAIGLGVSRTTVAATYAVLRDQRWLESRRGSGSRVRLPERGVAAGAQGRDTSGPAGVFGLRPAGSGDAFGVRPAGASVIADGLRAPAAGDPLGLIDLTTASPAAPTGPVQDALASAAAEFPGWLAGDGYFPFGLPALREAIAARYRSAGAPTTAEQILVTSGAQHGFSLIVRELTAPGDRVLVECPTYPVALDALRALRRVPAPVSVLQPDIDDGAVRGGWDLELVAATLRSTAPRLAYLIPDFQNPTGAVLPASDRARLVAAARRSGTVLVVDESFRDVPFPGSPALPPPLAASDDGTGVISIGSVSKSFWGGLRIGWVRASAAVIGRLTAARALGDMAGPVLDQLVVTALLADPEAALEQQRARLAAGAGALVAALEAALPEWRSTRPAGGASLWVRLPCPLATELALCAPSFGVSIAPGPRFGPDGTMESFLRLPFTVGADRLALGVGRLAQAWRALLRDRESGRAAVASLPGWLA